jgi:hypothetical protein
VQHLGCRSVRVVIDCGSPCILYLLAPITFQLHWLVCSSSATARVQAHTSRSSLTAPALYPAGRRYGMVELVLNETLRLVTFRFYVESAVGPPLVRVSAKSAHDDRSWKLRDSPRFRVGHTQRVARALSFATRSYDPHHLPQGCRRLSLSRANARQDLRDRSNI